MAYLDPIGLKSKSIVNLCWIFTIILHELVEIRSAPYLHNTTRYFAQLANGGRSGIGGWSWHRALSSPRMARPFQRNTQKVSRKGAPSSTTYTVSRFSVTIELSRDKDLRRKATYVHATLSMSYDILKRAKRRQPWRMIAIFYIEFFFKLAVLINIGSSSVLPHI